MVPRKLRAATLKTTRKQPSTKINQQQQQPKRFRPTSFVFLFGLISVFAVGLLAALNVQCLFATDGACGMFRNIVIPSNNYQKISTVQDYDKNKNNLLFLPPPPKTKRTSFLRNQKTAKTSNTDTFTNATSTFANKTKITTNVNYYNRKEDLIQQMLQTMKYRHNETLSRSARHQEKFHAQKHLLLSHFSKDQLYTTKTDNFAAIPINDDYAYIHIWKCGGTNMELQTNKAQTNLASITKHNIPYWMTFVRDPFDHFLSGWAECGHRDKTVPKRNRITRRWDNPQKHYNTIIMDWLNRSKSITKTQSGCMKHSFPQANTLIDKLYWEKRQEKHLHNTTTPIFDELVLVADLNEMGGVLEHVLQIPYNGSLNMAGKNSSKVKYTRLFFPSRIDWLSDESIRAVCEFLALDYFLFDFEPPPACGFLKEGTTLRN